MLLFQVLLIAFVVTFIGVVIVGVRRARAHSAAVISASRYHAGGLVETLPEGFPAVLHRQYPPINHRDGEQGFKPVETLWPAKGDAQPAVLTSFPTEERRVFPAEERRAVDVRFRRMVKQPKPPTSEEPVGWSIMEPLDDGLPLFKISRERHFDGITGPWFVTRVTPRKAPFGR